MKRRYSFNDNELLVIIKLLSRKRDEVASCIESLLDVIDGGYSQDDQCVIDLQYEYTFLSQLINKLR